MARTAPDGINTTTPTSVKLETAALPYLRRVGKNNISAALRRVTRDHLTAARILKAGADDAETLARLRELLLPDEQPAATTNQENATDGQTAA